MRSISPCVTLSPRSEVTAAAANVQLSCSTDAADKFKLIEEPGWFTNSRGQQLYTLTIAPSGSAPCSAVYVMHHGYSEHCHRHVHILRQLAQRVRLVVVTYDCHGHGHSEPLSPEARALVWHWQHLRDDLLHVIHYVAGPAGAARGVPAGRVFLGGHSMGGMTALLAALPLPPPAALPPSAAQLVKTQPLLTHSSHRHSAPGEDLAPAEDPCVSSTHTAAAPHIAGLVLSAPLVTCMPDGSWAEWLQVLVLTVLNWLIPTRPYLKRRPVATGCRDASAAAELLEDPLWHRDKVKVRTVMQCLKGTWVLQANAARMKVPLLVLQGTHDITCSIQGLHALLPKLGTKDITLVEVEGAYHDLAHDPDTPYLVDRTVSWLQQRIDLLQQHDPVSNGYA